MKQILDLTNGITKSNQYDAWKFPGGEIHVKLNGDYNNNDVEIVTRLNDSDKIIFLMLVVDAIRKDYKPNKLTLFIPYMPYQQADMDFGKGECFSLKTIANLINSMKFDKVRIFHPHSIVTPALIHNSQIIDNTFFVDVVISRIHRGFHGDLTYDEFINNLVILSADAGGYKTVFKTCEKIGFKGTVDSCSKSRNHYNGELTTKVPNIDENKIILIVDDISLGSRTFLNIRKELKNEKVYLAVSHGIFNENIDKLEKEFEHVFTTDSVRDESLSQKIDIIEIIDKF